ncbi:MAG: 30S ribosomal protein S12 methylthiotransferase RimO [Eggerthellaceae bacterium]|nr:30S ribosomal protein S12 methylthiotransferase RimO [Eggerthellaceae bacterium]
MGASSNKRIHIVTMGCAKNEVDSAHMAERLIEAGFTMVDDPRDADTIIVNTCSFIQAATEESIDMVFQMLGLDNVERGEAHVIVAGCMPARYGEDLANSLEEVKTFVPCSKEDDIAQVVADLFALDKGDDAKSTPFCCAQTGQSLLSHGYPSAYVKISDGCDRFCSYCAIPYIRGRYHSFPYEQIRCEVARQVDSGAREIVLIAQDTGRWGQDLPQTPTLAWLMGKLADEFSHVWFRVMYLQPEGITEELLDCIKMHDNIASYLDIPLQHVDAGILRAMNRRGSYEEYVSLVRWIRERVPGVTLRTTMIAGFPGESQEHFELMCDFLEEVEFDYVGVFPYSREEGTRAAGLPGQVEESTRLERAQIVRDVADAISEARIRERIGLTMDVLVLGCEEDGQVYGRALCQAPEVDGVVYLESGTCGDMVKVTIVDTLMYEMEGE